MKFKTNMIYCSLALSDMKNFFSRVKAEETREQTHHKRFQKVFSPNTTHRENVIYLISI